ncbi:sulfite exporter TauE/SafE family protein 3-like isoform X4 [Camellia sinensis]|uniref:sulfite exporter TauE/SafE family protein 3-like isoform X4 n=1 Tax=Camellia sinensis TaxID=4442 RepID=UPI001035B7BB|nr:sulfite exporter TauE/SafE family protein 3-like isoform X4 [Camellia sinensis]
MYMASTKMNQRAKAVAATVAAWVVCWCLFTVSDVGNAERLLKSSTDHRPQHFSEEEMRSGFGLRLIHFFWQNAKSSYEHVWPEMEFGWRLVVGSVVGFLGAALGSVGGVGGGGIFVPMLSLIIGFDPKSSTAISKCMIMGAAGSTVYYNLRLRHPTLDMPLIDYDLAMLFQPMLMLGISIGVAFNVIFADWMVTVLLIILFIGTSTKALFKGIETWNKETMNKEAAKQLESESKQVDDSGEEYKPLPSGPAASADEVSLLYNIQWKELGLLVFVWVAFLAVQIMKTYTVTCSVKYWIMNASQLRRNYSWHGGWIAWAWRRLHLGASFPRIGNSSSGSKCNINICDGFLVFHVSCTILPSETFPSPICCLFCFSCYNFRLCWSACSEEGYSNTWKGIHNHLHTGSDNLCERDQFRWGGNSKYDRETGES